MLDRARPRGRRRARCSASSGPPGCGKSTLLELIAGLREPQRGRDRGRRRARPPRRGSPAAPTCRSATCCCPGCAAIDNAALALRNRGAAARRGARARRRRCSSASGSPASSARGRPSSPAGCASGSPSCARCSPASRCCCSTSRSPRSTRSPAPRCRSGSPGRWPPSPRTVVLVTHDVEEALYLCRPGRRALGAGPRGAVAERRGARRPRATPRREAVTAPEFAAARERALAALAGGRAMRRWLLPAAVIVAALLGALAAGGALGPDRRRARHRAVPGPGARREIAAVAVGRPRAARRQRLGDAAGGPARLRARRRRRRRLRGRPAPLRHAAARLLPAARRLADVPIIVIAPILVVWFGFGIGPKLAIIALICFFPITVNTLDGLRSVDPELLQDDAHARRRAAGRSSAGSRRRPRCPTSSAAPRSRPRSR